MSRTRINYENVSSRFGEGTLAQIRSLLHEGELQSEFIRVAVANEIATREAIRRRARRSALLQSVSQPSAASE